MADVTGVRLTVLVIIAVIIDILFIITASLGIWLANGYVFSSKSGENGTKGFLITVLILALVLPVIFLLCAYNKIAT